MSAAHRHTLRGITVTAGTAIREAQLREATRRAYAQVVVSFVHAMEAHDSPTAAHSRRLVRVCVVLAQHLGCDATQVDHIRWAARFHDIGKIGVSGDILQKPGALTHHEWVLMRQHPIIGEEILRAVPWMQGVAKLVRHHQERWDGTGYPDGLRGEEIPLGARILAAVDAYCAMTEDRPYRTAARHADALTELRRCAGTQFDPRVVKAVFEVFELRT
ncbi:MAG TPA: HD-GYP domain-containing protein [bacterium]|nr:HD-GYP domain-containing protein [bacterium]